MMTKRLSGMVAVALMLLLFSCGKKSSSYTKYIPKDANYVVGIDVKSIIEKLEKDSLNVENMMTTFKNNGNTKEMTEVMELYKQFKESGIDWRSRVYIAVNVSNMMSGATPGVEVVAGLHDAAKFEAFLKKQPKTKDVKTGEGFTYTGDDEMAIGWTKDAVIFASAERSRPAYEDYMPDSLGNMTKPPSATTAGNSPAEKLKAYFKLDKAASILEADGFTDLQGKSGDVVVYSQSGDLSKSFPMMTMMPKLKELISGYHNLTTLNFEDGKVVMETDGYFSKELGDILKKYAGPEVDLDLVGNYPSNNVDGVMAFSFKPELISGLVTELGFDGPANMGLSQAGLTMNDVTKLFKGDFAVVVSDFAVQKEDAGKDAMTYGGEMPTVKMIFAAKIGDKAVLDKLLNIAQKEGAITRNGNMITIAGRGGQPSPYVISITNDVLIFASDAATHSAYLAKSQKIGLPSDANGKLKGKAVSTFVDFEKILGGFGATMFDNNNASGKAILDRAKTTFKNVYYTMDNFDGKVLNGEGELNFIDQKKNSLSQIIQFAMFAYQQEQAGREARMKEWNSLPSTTDSATTVPMMEAPVDTSTMPR